MIDSVKSYDIKITLKSHFFRKNVFMNVTTFPENLSTSGLSILLHVVISLIDAASYDKTI